MFSYEDDMTPLLYSPHNPEKLPATPIGTDWYRGEWDGPLNIFIDPVSVAAAAPAAHDAAAAPDGSGPRIRPQGAARVAPMVRPLLFPEASVVVVRARGRFVQLVLCSQIEPLPSQIPARNLLDKAGCPNSAVSSHVSVRWQL